jgi:3-deoxy-7-phosphoheptulonate synthase
VIVVMMRGATESDVVRVMNRLKAAGLTPVRSEEAGQTIVIGHGERGVDPRDLERLTGVDRAHPSHRPWRLAGRDAHPEPTVVTVAGHPVGGPELVMMAGPCAVESEAQVNEAARIARDGGAVILRGGAFKPRTSPYAFQGLGEPGLKLLAEAAGSQGLGVVSEVLDVDQIPLVARYADLLQVGARNMQNPPLLRALGRQPKPVLLKRGLSATIEDWLLAAEYILAEGNPNVILCERGIRTFETATRSTLDLSAVPVVRKLSHLPIIVDPSHAAGSRELIRPLARAAVAVGADGLLVELHPDPESARSDGPQSLDRDEFLALAADVRRIARALDRPLAAPRPLATAPPC